MDIPDGWETILNNLAALERENAYLRALLDDIHRGAAPAPPTPKRYDESAVKS